MNILVTGSSGLVGAALTARLRAEGHRVLRLVSQSPPPHTDDLIHWNPGTGMIDPAKLEGFDSVIHLAGENIAAGRWTASMKTRIRESRVQGTSLLAQTISRLKSPPKSLICASATGFYGDRGDELLAEESAPGAGFLAEVCRDWEASAKAAIESGIRTVHLRFGIILSRNGGALARMLPIFKLGLGGRVGHGRQFWPWLSLEDAVGIVLLAITNPGLRGAINAVAPQSATNGEFTAALGRALHRPTAIRVPAMVARLALGEMAEAALLASARVVPAKLIAAQYPFANPELEPTLGQLIH